MQFDTKIALAIRDDLQAWQMLNVAAFLAGGIAAAFPNCVGDSYEDGSGTRYHALIGQPILIYGADRAALTRALDRALARGVKAAVYTMTCSRPRTMPRTARWSGPCNGPTSTSWAWLSAPTARSSTRSSTD
jgi:hypothetical protein